MAGSGEPARTVRASIRTIEPGDLPSVLDLLCAGFPRRDRTYWEDGLRRLGAHAQPESVPRYGYLLQSDGVAVGVLLLIGTRDGDAVRCNVSSWYVQPEFRAYAPLLSLRGVKNPAFSYVNIWPAEHTRATIAAQGFAKVTSGYFAAAAALAAPRPGVRIHAHRAAWEHASGISEADLRLLADHVAFGCIGLWVETPSGGRPFIFRRRVSRLGLPSAVLIYAPSLEDVEALAGPLGRFLAMRGMPLMIVGSDRRLRGVPGRLFPERMAIYAKGTYRPRATDLSYTEVALLGM
jgi:hypothetical protein